MNQIRRMATKANVPLPLVLHGIDGRYATAIYSAAVRKNNLDKVADELVALKPFLKDPKIKYFLETPTIDRSKKLEGVKLIQNKIGLSETVSNFLNVLAENGRLKNTEQIVGAFESIMTAHRNELEVEVTTASEIDSKTLTKVKEILSKKQLMGGNKKLLIKTRVKTR